MRIRGRWKKNMGRNSTPTGEIKGRTPIAVSCPLRLGGIISLDMLTQYLLLAKVIHIMCLEDINGDANNIKKFPRK